MKNTEIKYINPKEFQESGYLQELNRLFLHPLGMALEVVFNDDDTVELGGIWDYRDDPEGMEFGIRNMDVNRHTKFLNNALKINKEIHNKLTKRKALFDSDVADITGIEPIIPLEDVT